MIQTRNKEVKDCKTEFHDDDILNHVLIMVEYFSLLERQDFYRLYKKDDIICSLDFLERQITKLEHYQQSFNLTPVVNRFEQINKHLDTVTIGTYEPNFGEHFSTDVSLTLDLLYNTITQLQNILDIYLMKDLNDY